MRFVCGSSVIISPGADKVYIYIYIGGGSRCNPGLVVCRFESPGDGLFRAHQSTSADWEAEKGQPCLAPNLLKDLCYWGHLSKDSFATGLNLLVAPSPLKDFFISKAV